MDDFDHYIKEFAQKDSDRTLILAKVIKEVAEQLTN